MAMFAVGKGVMVAPEYVSKQYEMWKDFVPKASKIFIIGVKVHEVDKHIWKVLGESKVWLAYFGFPAEKSEFDTWKDNHKKKNAYFYEEDFESSINTIKKRMNIK